MRCALKSTFWSVPFVFIGTAKDRKTPPYPFALKTVKNGKIKIILIEAVMTLCRALTNHVGQLGAQDRNFV
jgi:hypothetical protein